MSPEMGTVSGVDVTAAIAAHTAILDAHIRSDLQIFRTGHYMPSFATGEPNKTRDSAVDEITAHPLVIARTMTFDRIAAEVTVPAGAGEKARLGIYANGINCYPGALILDAGEIALDAVAVAPLIIDLQLTRGIYWLALLANGNATLLAQQPATPVLGFRETDFGTPYAYYKKAGIAYGALPDPFPAAGGDEINYGPTMLLRLASLD